VTLGMDNFTGFFGNPSGLNAHAGLNIGFGRAKSKQLTQAEIEKQKEAEVEEAKNEAKEKAKKRTKKTPKEGNEPMKKTDVFVTPRPVEQPDIRPSKMPEGEPEEPKMADKKVENTAKMPEKSAKEGPLSIKPAKAPATVATAPKPNVSTTPVKPQEMPAKAPSTVATAPKPNVSATPAKPQEMPAKAPSTVATAPKPNVSATPTKPQEMPAKAPATVANAPKTNVSPISAKPQEKSAKEGPLSITPPKTPTVVVAPKPSVPMLAEKPVPIVLSPVGSGKMGECIEFYPNKAAISGNSLACLKEISKFLLANKSIKLSVSGNVLSTDKVADPTSLKTERAKTVRNFLIQSGVEPARLTVKLMDNSGAAPVVLMPQ
jgi:outer membrane protein OmpA-like peptidoglycan-associated protein